MGLLLAGCTGDGWAPEDLQPYPNSFVEGEELWSPQPRRLDPTQVVARGGKAWVSLAGTVDEPGRQLAVVDTRSAELISRIEVGSNPMALALNPAGPWLLQLNRLSNWAGIVDTEDDVLIGKIPMDDYAAGAAFAPQGDEVWVSNRWRDEVQVYAWASPTDVWQVDALPVAANPRDVAISGDGSRVAVASVTTLTVTLFDRESRTQVAAIDLRSPPNGIAFSGDWLIVATTSAASNNSALAGPDGDGDGAPGDGTPNVNFQDMQNELVVMDGRTGDIAWRYTSDSICCRDFRDVDPQDVGLRGDLLPDSSLWIVGGALPEQLAVDPRGVWVTYSASDQFQHFDVDPATGALTAGAVRDTLGFNPIGIAVDDGGRLAIAHRLSETLGVYDAGGEAGTSVDVGDLSGGAFPATDAEIGELFNNVTAPFTVDGDQSCTQCHREGGNLAKPVGMPLAAYPGVNRRMVNAYRGAFDTRPWFFEGAMDETNFRPVINEFARVENFCCEDPTLFPEGAPADCAENPPPECGSEPNAGTVDGFNATRTGVEHPHARPTAAPTRDAFFLASAEAGIGRTETFGDGVYYENPVTGERSPLPLTFEGITRSLGIFLLTDTQLLPNPNDPDAPDARRGAAIFNSAGTNCASCHPPPTFTVSTTNNPLDLPLRMPPVVTPDRRDDGVNLDLLSTGFMGTFPAAEQDACEDVCDAATCAADPKACDDLRNLHLSPPTLVGIWDRAPRFLHDGRAHSLREALCTPGHPALLPGEIGYNERDGIPDTHGGTSQLTPGEMADLIAYLDTL